MTKRDRKPAATNPCFHVDRIDIEVFLYIVYVYFGLNE